jgi:DNA primase
MTQAERANTEELRHVGDILGDAEPRYMVKKAIETVKTAVAIEQVAAEYGEFRLLGRGRLLGRCVAPDHEDRTPSLTVYTEEGRFKCFGCGLFGDAVDLERVAGRHVEAWTAVIALAERYGVELPERPMRRHKRQRPVRDALEQVRINSVRRRMFRIFVRETLANIEDEDERREEGRAIWDELLPIARMLVARGGRA